MSSNVILIFFICIVDKADEHDTKIEMMHCKLAGIEDDQTNIKAGIAKINIFIKDLENKFTIKEQVIDWKSFAFGAIALACIWFAIHRMI